METDHEEGSRTERMGGDSLKGVRTTMSGQSGPVERVPSTEDEIRAATVGELTPLSGPIQIVDYDPQ